MTSADIDLSNRFRYTYYDYIRVRITGGYAGVIVEIVAVFLLAKIRRYRLFPLFRAWAFYPIFAVQLIGILCQGSLFLHSTLFVKWMPYMEPAAILSFLPALFVYQLYKPAIFGAGGIVAGTALNRLVIAQNAGHMPVYPSLSYLTGYVTPAQFGSLDTLHILGGDGVKLAFLSDYIDFGYCILSPGDVLLHLYTCIMLYALIKAVNRRCGQQPNAAPERSALS